MMELKNLAAAKIKATMALEPLRKDAQNPHFKSRYSSLASVLDVVQEAYSKAGIAIFEGVSTSDGVVSVEVTLCHAESGESITHQLPMPVVGNTAQAIGSAITYGRRYLLMTMCGVAPEDDDGEEASRGNGRIQASMQRQPQRPATELPPMSAEEKWDNIPAEEEWDNIPAYQEGNAEPAQASKPAMPAALRKKFHGLGVELYGDSWDTKRRELVKAMTTGQTENSNDLTVAEMKRLIVGMEARLVSKQPANGTA